MSTALSKIALNKIYDDTASSYQWGCYRDESKMVFEYKTDDKHIDIVVPLEDSEYQSSVEVRRWEGRRVKYSASLYFYTLEGHVEGYELGSRIEKKAEKIFSAL